ncbi:FAD-dependent oxidoreductase [Paenibacillus sp. strain BS8-2]
MSFFGDFLKMFKKKEITFVESIQESEDVYSFLFKKDGDVSWNAGQHGLFRIAHKKVKNPLKPFSVASAPSENIIRLTMRIGHQPSEYKQAMLELTPGMKVNMTGPVGGFQLQEHTPSVFIAGGIGITPFRAMLKQVESQGKRDMKPIHLLYLDSKQNYLYKEELDAIAAHPSISVAYLESREELQRELDGVTGQYKNDAVYYIAGPKAMVTSFADLVQKNGITKGQIKKDAFFGY